MGHTLVTHFDDESMEKICKLFDGVDENFSKIPYGRNCDRYAVDKILPYHVTIASWKTEHDAEYLEKISSLSFFPFTMVADEVMLQYGTDGTGILYLKIDMSDMDPGCMSLAFQLFNMGIGVKNYFHITLAISKNPDKLSRIKKQVDLNAVCPVTLKVDGLSLFHIWDDCRLVKIIK